MPIAPSRLATKTDEDLPEPLKAYAFHGLDLSGYRRGQTNTLTDCPFCGSEKAMSIKVENGVFRCYKCVREDTKKGGGNATVFVQHLWKLGEAETTGLEREVLARGRGLLSPDTLAAWGVVRSPITREWLVPGYSPDGVLRQLYRYATVGGKARLLATPTLSHQLHGTAPGLYDDKKRFVYVCEGPWDAMALWEVMGGCKAANGALVPATRGASLLADGNVIAVPGCSVFLDSWTEAFPGKSVVLLYDSDHPRPHRTNPDVVLPPAGFEGVRRASARLLASSAPPADVSYLSWGMDGYDPNLPSGYDLRDCLGHPDRSDRIARLGGLLDQVHPVPPEWKAEAEAEAEKAPSVELIDCSTYAELREAWEKAMEWTDGLDHALICMLASVCSVQVLEDQLWMKIIGPASCGKSTLCEAVSTARKYVYPKSSLRGFHSGYKTDAAGEEDNSLVMKVNGKTLVTKDGDTILQSEMLGKILSEARDLYDGASRSHYLNAMSRDYENVRFTWLLCGTEALRALDSSELGERFLDVVIMDGIDPAMERRVLKMKALQVARNTNLLTNGSAASMVDPEKARAMGMTGGYVVYLRENAGELLSGVEFPDEAADRIIDLALFVAHMRARPSTRQAETAEREFGARLLTQLMKLAKCLAVVLNKSSVDAEVLKTVTRVAHDTARGSTLKMCRYLFYNPAGMQTKALSLNTKIGETSVKYLLAFLNKIDVVETFVDTAEGLSGRKTNVQLWRLTPTMHALWERVEPRDESLLTADE